MYYTDFTIEMTSTEMLDKAMQNSTPKKYARLLLEGAEIIRQLRQERGHKWIRAEDHLPETEDHVLCFTRTKSGQKNVVRGYYMDGQWRCGMNSNVTHWMPMPAPPEGRER